MNFQVIFIAGSFALSILFFSFVNAERTEACIDCSHNGRLTAIIIPTQTQSVIETSRQIKAMVPPPASASQSTLQPTLQCREVKDGVGVASVYKSKKMIAAHRTLKLGSRVRVTRLNSQGRPMFKGGKKMTVEVKINDRNPYVKTAQGRMPASVRTIKLASAAAKKLEFYNGEIRVKVEECH